MNEEIRDAEKRHASADTDQRRVNRTSGLTADDDARRRDRRMQKREAVVLLEPTRARLVMRSMHRPQATVPCMAMKEPRPVLHRVRGEQRRHDGDRELAHMILPRNVGEVSA